MAPVQRSPGARNSGNRGCTPFLAALTNSPRSSDKAATLTPSRPAAERITAGTHAFLSAWKATTCAPPSLANHRTTSKLRAESFSTSKTGPRRLTGPVELSIRLTAFLDCAWLPDLASLLAHHRLALFATERLGKLRHIRKRSVAAEPGQRVRVGVGHQPSVFDPLIGAPDLRPTEEEALLGSEAVSVRWPRFARQGFFKRSIGDRQSTQVGDALPQNQLTILVQVAVDDVGVELIGDAGGARLEILQVFRAPPVFQVALTVELTAVIVKPMRDFMSDDRSHSSVVHRVIGLRIVERGLQNACGKDDFIHAAVVVGVHGWRRHAPFRAVHRLADLVQPAREIEFRTAQLIFGVGPAVDFQRRVIAPLFRVADFHRESLEFPCGLRAGVRSHPGQRL